MCFKETRKTYVLSILSCRTVANCKTAADEIILNIHHNESCAWTSHLQSAVLRDIIHIYSSIFTFLIHSVQQKTNSCLLMLPLLLTLKMFKISCTMSVDILKRNIYNIFWNFFFLLFKMYKMFPESVVLCRYIRPFSLVDFLLIATSSKQRNEKTLLQRQSNLLVG